MTDIKIAGTGGEAQSPIITGTVTLTFGSLATNVGASASAVAPGVTAGHRAVLQASQTPGVSAVGLAITNTVCTQDTITCSGINASAGTKDEGSPTFAFFAFKA